MSEEQDKKRDMSFTHRYDTVAAFLGIELIALALFGFGGLTGLAILQIAAIFVAFMTVPFIRNNNPGKKWIKKAIIAVAPIAIMMLLLGFGRFWSVAYYGGNVLNIILYGGLTFLGGTAFFVLGYGLSQIKAAKLEYIVIGALIGLGLYVLVVGGYSLFRYGPFYASRFNGMVYYYDGVIFPIASETKALIGFEFFVVSLSYGKVAATILAASGAGLVHLFRIGKKRNFFIVLGLCLLGWLDLILVPYLSGIRIVLIGYVIIGLAYLLIWLFKNKKSMQKPVHLVANIIFFATIGLVFAGTIVMFVEAKTSFIEEMNIPRLSAGFGDKGSSLGQMKAAFLMTMNNGSSSDVSSFNLGSFLFGCTPSAIINPKPFEFSSLYQTGILGYIALLAVIFMGIRQSRNYLLEDGDDMGYRMIIVALLIVAFLYFSLANDEAPLVYSDQFDPLSRRSIAFGMVFLLGLTYRNALKEEGQ